jgi:hypothetical protein
MAVKRDVYTVIGMAWGNRRRCSSDRQRRIYANRGTYWQPFRFEFSPRHSTRWARRTGERPHSKKPVRSAVAAPLKA